MYNSPVTAVYAIAKQVLELSAAKGFPLDWVESEPPDYTSVDGGLEDRAPKGSRRCRRPRYAAHGGGVALKGWFARILRSKEAVTSLKHHLAKLPSPADHPTS